MGSNDEAENCDLAELYFLNRLIKTKLVYIHTTGLLQQIMQMVQSLIELGTILSCYSRKKNFQPPSKQILEMLTSTLQQKNTFLSKRLTIHHSTPSPFLNNHLHSSSSCLNDQQFIQRQICLWNRTKGQWAFFRNAFWKW